MVRDIRMRSATKQEGMIALKKAHQFAETARDAYGNERWDSAGLNAIHAGISAADAVLIRTAGERCASADHAHVSNVLARLVTSYKGSPKTQLLGLLKMKNIVAYEQRLITQNEASQLVKAADRFLAWADGQCPD